MPLCESKINHEIASDILKTNYKITCTDFQRIHGGSANLYWILASDFNQYILKEFQNDFDINKVIREVKITEILKKKGIPTVEFINTVDNTNYCFNDKNIVTLQKYIEGNTKDFHTLNENQYQEAADYYYKIIDILNQNDINLPSFKMNIFDFNYSNINIEKCNLLIDSCNDVEISKILNDKKKMLQEFSNLDFSEINKVTFLNSHGDYNNSQFIYDEYGKIKAILDFASAKRLPIVWELFRSYVFMDSTYDNGKFNLDGLIKYLSYFNKEKMLSEYDLKYIFSIYYAYLLNSTFGLEQFINNNSEQYRLIGIDLYNQTKFLYENMEDMNKLLLKRRQEVI